MFMPGDKVKYTGSNVFQDSSGAVNLNSKIGEVVTKVSGEDKAYVVEFGDESFILHEDNLRRHYFTPGNEPVKQQRRRNDPDLD